MPIATLDKAAQDARDRLHQSFLYYFGRAIPDLDAHGDAVGDIGEFTDLLVEAAALRALIAVRNTDVAYQAARTVKDMLKAAGNNKCQQN
jgi:hypothetical protein